MYVFCPLFACASRVLDLDFASEHHLVCQSNNLPCRRRVFCTAGELSADLAAICDLTSCLGI
jgi:hypothetical protein